MVDQAAAAWQPLRGGAANGGEPTVVPVEIVKMAVVACWPSRDDNERQGLSAAARIRAQGRRRGGRDQPGHRRL